jgi:hypothetical protein
MNYKNTPSKLKILFSTSKLLIEYLKDPYFEGRKLVIKGEALSCGFDAYPSTMKWIKPFENEIITDIQKRYLLDSINNEIKNYSTGFQIIWEEE